MLTMQLLKRQPNPHLGTSDLIRTTIQVRDMV